MLESFLSVERAAWGLVICQLRDLERVQEGANKTKQNKKTERRINHKKKFLRLP